MYVIRAVCDLSLQAYFLAGVELQHTPFGELVLCRWSERKGLTFERRDGAELVLSMVRRWLPTEPRASVVEVDA